MMQRYNDFSPVLYGSISPVRPTETTAKVIASEVAVGENTYYGSIRPIGDDYDSQSMAGTLRRPPSSILDASFATQQGHHHTMNTTTSSTAAGAGTPTAVMASMFNDWSGAIEGGAGNLSTVAMAMEVAADDYDDRLGEYHHNHSTSSTAAATTEAKSPPLSLQLFISSLSDALSYTSADTTTATEFRYNGGPQGSSVLNVTPMGSTTKLIASETSSNFKLRFCGAKCFPIFGTLFMTISLTASLGNVLRLPGTVFLHGGGTFFVAYICIAIILGIPLSFLEITLGQFCQQGTTKLWRAVPLFKGVGVVKLLSCTILCLYYPILMVNAIFYSIWSLYQPLPTSQCITKLLPRFTTQTDLAEYQKLCFRNESRIALYGGDDEVAWFGVEICLLLIVWTLIMLCIFKSANSFRLSACIIVPSALFIAVTLLTEGIQRNTNGLRSLLDIQWESLLSFEIWYAALIQFFLSTHIGLGNITTCAGRLYPKNNPFWTSVFYMLVNLAVGMSFVAVVYMWIEDLTVATGGKPVQMSQTQELFVLTLIYDVMSQCYGKFAQLWAFMAYLFIILAGFSSMISLIYTVIVGITVETKSKWKWWRISSIVCGICFGAGCFCLLPDNFAMVRLFDHYTVGKLIVTTTVLEVVAFVWFYGLESLANDFEFVLGYKLNIIWKTLWFLCPFLLTVTEVWSWFSGSSTEATYTKSDSFRLSIVGWIIYVISWIVIIAMGAWQVFSQVDYNLSQKFSSSTKPTRNWGPVDPIYRHCWVQWKKQYQATGEKDFTLRRRGTRDYTHSVKRTRHAGPVGMRYSVNPSSNQNTLQYSRNSGANCSISDKDPNHLQYSYSINCVADNSTWTNSNLQFHMSGLKSPHN
ncbi:sodium-dependent nutrient amino acid transporter 1-like [Planococcus citri]|uniref:sodium-dependent nutrient amino acid transporter 1-like n=1 Tax=Planococcus citri TaxID=170843 RepID=UPI0031F7C806